MMPFYYFAIYYCHITMLHCAIADYFSPYMLRYYIHTLCFRYMPYDFAFIIFAIVDIFAITLHYAFAALR